MSGSQALQKSMANHAVPVRWDAPPASTIFYGVGHRLERLTFLEGMQPKDLETAVAQVGADASKPAIYISGDYGLNAIIPQASLKRINIELGTGDDVVSIGKMNRPLVTINAGAGDDRITTACKRVFVDGQIGDDRIVATNATFPILYGGAGDDQILVNACSTPYVDGGVGRDSSNRPRADAVELLVDL